MTLNGATTEPQEINKKKGPTPIMPYVNYIRENEAFIAEASDLNLGSNARLLWYALFHCLNQRANGGYFPEQISISNKVLLSLVPFSEDALTKARNQLAQHGFIRYKAGERRAATPQYTMIYMDERRGYPEETHAGEDSRGFYPTGTGKTEGKQTGKTEGKQQGKTGGNVQGKKGDLYPNYNKTETEYQTGYPEEDEDEEDISAEQTGACARELTSLADNLAAFAVSARVRAAFAEAFGYTPTTSEVNSISTLVQAFDAEEIMGRVIEEAAKQGAKNPVAYIRALLSEADTYHAKSLARYEHLRYLQNLLRNADMRYSVNMSL